jgi:hypothetical protein
MKAAQQRVFLIIFSLIMVACTHMPATASPDAQTDQYFRETGYTVKGEFLDFFYIYGGLESLGYPLSEEMVVDGWKTQYFERGRLEYHPENEPAYQVTIGWLGDLLHRRRPAIPATNIPGSDKLNSRYYPKTGHTLSGDFLRYFDSHGGSVRFGLPISEPFLWQGQLVQDFQSARFIWKPIAPERVSLENIGQLHLERIKREE